MNEYLELSLYLEYKLELLSESIRVAVTCTSPCSDLPLPSSYMLNTFISEKRKKEYVSGRWCAHESLKKLSVYAHHIATNSLGGPEWPQRIVGSISHDTDLCIAIAVRDDVLKSVGIDVHDYLRKDIDWGKIKFLFLTKQELLLDNSLLYNKLDIIYSCKESVIKCLSPISLQYLDPRKITINLEFEKNTFQAESAYAQDLVVHGFYYLTNRFIVTLAYIQNI